MLIACALAGAAARVIKITSGRARPSVKTESVWNGPRLSSKYHAFPSGHTAASTAFFGTLLFVSWRIGLACLPIPIFDRGLAHVCRRALFFRCALRRNPRNHVRAPGGEVAFVERLRRIELAEFNVRSGGESRKHLDRFFDVLHFSFRLMLDVERWTLDVRL